MDSSIFPPATSGNEDGVIGFSSIINCDMLLDAYYHGIFPWPFEERSILWSSPKMRAIISMDNVHIPKSLSRELKQDKFEIRVDTCFADVIDACASVKRPDEDGTWITRKMRKAYKDFHLQGYAHSFEAFNKEGKLAGGLYGVLIGRIFCGESMFFHESGASKIAFCHAIDILRQHNVEIIDTQMVTNLTKSFGAHEIPIAEYLSLLKKLRDDKPTPLR